MIMQTTAVNTNVTSTGTSKDTLLLLLSSNCSTNASGLCANTTTTTQTTNNNYRLLLPIGVIIVIVLAAACLLLGVVYGYVYFMHVSGKTNKDTRHKSTRQHQHSEHHHQQGGGSIDPSAGHRDDSDPSYTTHMFLFRKHHSVACPGGT